MKKFWINHGYNLVFGIIGISSSALFTYFTNYATNVVCIRAYWIIVIAFAPLLCYFTIKRIIAGYHHHYKTGDAVNVIADSRKFIVVRYHFFRAYYAVCKVENTSVIMSVHQKYLKPYEKIERDFFGNLSDDNINTIVHTVTMRHL
ncbi:MAG: hypothetical protein RQ875_14765 [Vicingaceae bacterium]|nr:hypothetical protein [Vicingaceae bacterium]